MDTLKHVFILISARNTEQILKLNTFGHQENLL
jgi:hypothetical protein